MKTLFMPLIAALGLALVGTGSVLATGQTDSAGIMTVSDRAQAFTESGISKAKDAFQNTTFHARTEFHVEVYPELPEGKRGEFDRLKKEKDTPGINRFFGDFANELAKKHNSKGVFLVVFRKEGHVHAIDDRQTDAKRSVGFDDRKLKTVQEKLIFGFAGASKLSDKNGPEAKKLRDEALLDTTNYIASELKDTTVPHGNHAVKSDEKKAGGSNIGTYICLGVVALLGIWLVVGIFRALSNRGGGGGYGPGGGGYGGGGYGGGGGGFGSGLLGGLFGGMAGMWMYNNMFGGSHASDMSAGQGGDMGNSGGGDYNDTGAGDYDGGGDGGGSNYDEGGGDYGGSPDTGGGGDWGGGDTGGGGGDFGGGGGDW